MNVITIPKKWSGKELVLIPREEYEAMQMRHPLSVKRIKETRLTKAQRRAFECAERNFASGKFLTINELKRSLASRR